MGAYNAHNGEWMRRLLPRAWYQCGRGESQYAPTYSPAVIVPGHHRGSSPIVEPTKMHMQHDSPEKSAGTKTDKHGETDDNTVARDIRAIGRQTEQNRHRGRGKVYLKLCHASGCIARSGGRTGQCRSSRKETEICGHTGRTKPNSR
jgi:hypothetical protein